MNGVNEIRTAFLDYFGRHGHEIVASSPLVPRNDPTLMFTNAGMVQFKNVFTASKSGPIRVPRRRRMRSAPAASTMISTMSAIRRANHTFFEMLGNFSFGDYFKAEAIELAYKLTTQVFGLPKDKLLVTVYHTDDEAFDLWKKIAGFPDSKIIRIPTSDNFWSMGDTGPCGPCSEIFYDQGDKLAGGPPGSPDEDGDRFLEFWNLVFMQYEQFAPGERVGLPRPSIDTGMGLERIAALLQGVQSNYDIDLMRALVLAVAQATGADPDGPQKASHRVIADHLRASAFLVADGVLPVERGPRLCGAPDHAPRHAPRAATWRPRAGDVAAGSGTGTRNGAGLSGAHSRRSADCRDTAAGGDALYQHIGAWTYDPRRGNARSAEGRRVARRGGFQALRHLRLPA